MIGSVPPRGLRGTRSCRWLAAAVPLLIAGLLIVPPMGRLAGPAVAATVGPRGGPHHGIPALQGRQTNLSAGYVRYVLDFATNTLESSNFSAPYDAVNSSFEVSVGQEVYDPANAYMFVSTINLSVNLTDSGTRIYLVDSQTDRIVGHLPFAVTRYVTDMVYDPTTESIYLLSGTFLVQVRPDDTTTVIDPWPGGANGSTWYLDGEEVYDASNGQIYISANTTVLQFDPGSGKFVFYINFPLGFEPLWMSVDPVTNTLYVLNKTLGISNLARDNVTVVNLTAPSQPAQQIPLGNDSVSLLYDPADGTTWAYNSYPSAGGNSATISVLAANDSVVATIRAPTVGFGDLVYDAENGEVYLSYLVPAELLALNASTYAVVGTVPLPFPVTALAPDPSNGLLFASATYNFSIVLISTSASPGVPSSPPGGGGAPPNPGSAPTTPRPSVVGSSGGGLPTALILVAGLSAGVAAASIAVGIQRARPRR